MKTNPRKIVYLIISLAVIAIIATWWINGAELEDLWLYIVSIGVVIAGIPITQPKKDKDGGQ